MEPWPRLKRRIQPKGRRSWPATSTRQASAAREGRRPSALCATPYRQAEKNLTPRQAAQGSDPQMHEALGACCVNMSHATSIADSYPRTPSWPLAFRNREDR